jgi:hypothetical protein
MVSITSSKQLSSDDTTGVGDGRSTMPSSSSLQQPVADDDVVVVVVGRTILASIISGIAFTMLSIRVYLSSQRPASTVWSGINFLSHYFTILTNAWLMISMLYVSYTEGIILMHRKKESSTTCPTTTTTTTKVAAALHPSYFLAMVTSIGIVGLVYHIALAHLIKLPPGILPLLSDQGLHTVVPFMTLLWWVFYEAPIRKLHWYDVAWTIPWPMTYTIYILFRAIVLDEQLYPYPFLNLPVIGTAQLCINILGLSVAFTLLGTFLIRLNHTIYYNNSLRNSNKQQYENIIHLKKS